MGEMGDSPGLCNYRWDTPFAGLLDFEDRHWEVVMHPRLSVLIDGFLDPRRYMCLLHLPMSV